MRWRVNGAQPERYSSTVPHAPGMRRVRDAGITNSPNSATTATWSSAFRRDNEYQQLDKTQTPFTYRSNTVSALMGKKVLQCFPWYKRCKDREKGRLCPPQPADELQPTFHPSISWPCSREAAEARPVYFSHKARVSYRHQMDGNIIDATC